MKILTIRIKFDGVVHDRNDGWQNGAVYGPPIPGAIEKIKELLANPRYAIVISTQRTNLDDVVEWLAALGVQAKRETDAERMYWPQTDAEREGWPETVRVLVTGRPVTAQLRVETNSVEFVRDENGDGNWGDVDARLSELY